MNYLAVVVCLRLLCVCDLIVLLLCFLLMNLSLIGLGFGYGVYVDGFADLYWFMFMLAGCYMLLFATAWLFGLIALCLVGLLLCLMFDLVGW